ncbi:Amylosucrase [Pirellulimonas nuda]|uniref:Amylosucrase n=1 Tax=Pirellulimonas nuda TaxID=2528009 RepID=A0A518D6Q7_9BACT|nr:amylosucrase [Pirellulimonas nuda]QDU87129.1 Amylosucrase [Pirellulimonas nuda]
MIQHPTTPLPDADPEIRRRAAESLRRLLPRVEARVHDQIEPEAWDAFTRRLEEHFPKLFLYLHLLYGSHYDFLFHLEDILTTVTQAWLERDGELQALDALRETDPRWYQSSRILGAACYVDLFADDLAGLRERIPYLVELGVTYLHLMPLFRSPEGDNDGGYAVSSYREVDEALGTMAQLRELSTQLRHHGISLVVDFVLNHTSDEHPWARRAAAGDPEHQGYYRLFPDRELPDAYERSMADVFPDDHAGSFIYRNDMGRWVWTTFHNYQWDLNYQNPKLLDRMLGEMLFLANQGVEVLRFDAVAFLWKEIGTDSQNLPGAHWVIRAMSAALKIVAPASVIKSEAIVHPDEVRRYIHHDECQLSYNPELMALMWDSLATRKTAVLHNALERRLTIPEDCQWVNYIRCHDDIGWAFSNTDILASGFDPDEHRRFLTRFYTGIHPGTFARGLPFQLNPATGDGRVSGACASLCGLERALELDDPKEIDHAVRRILLMHGVILTLGGIPLIYLGDEIAMLNDYSFQQDPERSSDSRWVHRPRFDWDRAEQRHDTDTIPGRVFQGLLRFIQLRKQHPAFNSSNTQLVETGNDHLLGYFRSHGEHGVLVLANFDDHPQEIEGRRLRTLGLRKTVIDMVDGDAIFAAQSLTLEPYRLMVLARPQ